MLVWELSGSENLPKFVKDGKTLGGKLNNDNVKWKYSEMPCSYKIEGIGTYEGTYRQYKIDGNTMEFNVATHTNQNKILSFIIYASSPCTLFFNAN